MPNCRKTHQPCNCCPMPNCKFAEAELCLLLLFHMVDMHVTILQLLPHDPLPGGTNSYHSCAMPNCMKTHWACSCCPSGAPGGKTILQLLHACLHGWTAVPLMLLPHAQLHGGTCMEAQRSCHKCLLHTLQGCTNAEFTTVELR